MRTILLLILFVGGCLSPKAQNFLPVGDLAFNPWRPFSTFPSFGRGHDLGHHWQLNTYSGLSAGYTFFNAAGAGYLAAPVGAQVSRPLNHNVLVFAGASATPLLLRGSSFAGPFSGNAYPGAGANPYRFGMNSRVEMGLMYINDAKTFSISGSIGVERGGYPGYYPPLQAPVNKR